MCLALVVTLEPVGGSRPAASPTFILHLQVHGAQYLQHAVHDAGVCGSNDRLTRQTTGQGGYSLDLVHPLEMESRLPDS